MTDRFLYWLRDNAPDGWAWPVVTILMWLIACFAWGAIWGWWRNS